MWKKVLVTDNILDAIVNVSTKRNLMPNRIERRTDMSPEEKIDISEIIDQNLITLDLQATTKLDAIKELTELLFANNDINNKEDFIADVLLRETEGVTGIGQGVAIPHGKSAAVNNTTIAIGLSKHDIEWETLDGAPVTAIILFAVRDQDANTLHLKLLQKVAILLSDDNFIENLHQVESKEALEKMFIS